MGLAAVDWWLLICCGRDGPRCAQRGHHDHGEEKDDHRAHPRGELHPVTEGLPGDIAQGRAQAVGQLLRDGEGGAYGVCGRGDDIVRYSGGRASWTSAR
ncbi:hypothetical protein Jiend_52960 [Micromonospora endophytica]|nr:hypothetical protein Jiend_52960 [Micromonospora endophytica]